MVWKDSVPAAFRDDLMPRCALRSAAGVGARSAPAGWLPWNLAISAARRGLAGLLTSCI
jgi:hypothetical protein